jgi:hypothetical protein
MLTGLTENGGTMSSTKRGRKPLLIVTSNAVTTADTPSARFVLIDATHPTSEGDPAVGVVGTKVPSGEYAPITTHGIEFIELQATVTAGAVVTTGTDGKAKAHTTDDHIMGIALDGGDNGDIIRIKL